MSPLNIFKRERVQAPAVEAALVQVEQLSLEQLLTEIERHGEPSLSKHVNMADGENWLCRVNVRVTASGVTFEAKCWASTARAAAAGCLHNLVNALKQIGGVV